MAIIEHVDILKRDKWEWNSWRFDNPDVNLDLSGADLSEADLRARILDNAILTDANLILADFTNSDLVGAQLNGAILDEADFSYVNLSKADLSETRLLYTVLIGANLNEANLNLAELGETIFGDTNLKGVIGLKMCKHRSPSTIDHRTLAQSGNLPLSFLRGCGLPDFIIDNVSILQTDPQFYSCFISHSSKDEDFANRLYADLQDRGIRCWFAPANMMGGTKLDHQINAAIRSHDKLILILSEHSMQSDWVTHEIKIAR